MEATSFMFSVIYSRTGGDCCTFLTFFFFVRSLLTPLFSRLIIVLFGGIELGKLISELLVFMKFEIDYFYSCKFFILPFIFVTGLLGGELFTSSILCIEFIWMFCIFFDPWPETAESASSDVRLKLPTYLLLLELISLMEFFLWILTMSWKYFLDLTLFPSLIICQMVWLSFSFPIELLQSSTGDSWRSFPVSVYI